MTKTREMIEAWANEHKASLIRVSHKGHRVWAVHGICDRYCLGRGDGVIYAYQWGQTLAELARFLGVR